MKLFISGFRYATNLGNMVARQQGYLAAAAAVTRFLLGELVKLPTVARLTLHGHPPHRQATNHPTVYSPDIMQGIRALGVPIEPYTIDSAALHAHVTQYRYPRNYAGGPVTAGGARELKLLEYFLSLELLHVQAPDVVIDIASQWSIFPDMLRDTIGATIYRQDLLYPDGIHGDRIGGSAATLPLPDAFADKLVLHNAFEHFEGAADTDFIIEAWRILRPGGRLCILPLYLSDQYCILTDPLVNRRGVVWDTGAQVIELPWWHNRFGRFYDPVALQRRVLAPALQLGFTPRIYHIRNVHDIQARSHLHWALLFEKPAQHPHT